MARSKRTDKRGRILRTGECQRKDGRYQFQYKNSAGKRQCVYDTTLSGLREKEKQILKDLQDGIRSEDSRKITVSDLVEMYFEHHRGIKEATSSSYRKIFHTHIKGCR